MLLHIIFEFLRAFYILPAYNIEILVRIRKIQFLEHLCSEEFGEWLVVKKRRFEPDPNKLDFDLVEGITTDEKSVRMIRSNSVTKPPPQQPAG